MNNIVVSFFNYNIHKMGMGRSIKFDFYKINFLFSVIYK